MSHYALYFLTPDGRVPAMDFALAEDDGEAVRSAFAQLRQHATCRGVEVFHGERLVARMDNAGAPRMGPVLQGAG